MCADAFANDANLATVSVDEIPDDMMGLDIGPETAELYAEAIGMAKSVFWNGPMGVFEMPSFEAGTRAVAEAVAANEEADTIIGGGDSVAAVNQFDLADKMTFISTAAVPPWSSSRARRSPASRPFARKEAICPARTSLPATGR